MHKTGIDNNVSGCDRIDVRLAVIRTLSARANLILRGIFNWLNVLRSRAERSAHTKLWPIAHGALVVRLMTKSKCVRSIDCGVADRRIAARDSDWRQWLTQFKALFLSSFLYYFIKENIYFSRLCSVCIKRQQRTHQSHGWSFDRDFAKIFFFHIFSFVHFGFCYSFILVEIHLFVFRPQIEFWPNEFWCICDVFFGALRAVEDCRKVKKNL